MTQKRTAPPRVYCIPALRAPVLAVIRRGPTEWHHVGRWDVEKLTFQSGAWFKGQLYPQKCDLSPDGRWLLYSGMKVGADWPGGEIFEAVSRLPWLHALAAWEAGSTYTRGAHFVDEPRECALGAPDVGEAEPVLERLGIALNVPEQFSVERRRGWTVTDDSEPRLPGDMWDERRVVRMRKARPGPNGHPGGALDLRVEGSYAAFRSSPDARTPAEYSLWSDEDIVPLDAQWADWDHRGRLLLVTSEGRLRVADDPMEPHNTRFDFDLASLSPDPQEPPNWAEEW